MRQAAPGARRRLRNARSGCAIARFPGCWVDDSAPQPELRAGGVWSWSAARWPGNPRGISGVLVAERPSAEDGALPVRRASVGRAGRQLRGLADAGEITGDARRVFEDGDQPHASPADGTGERVDGERAREELRPRPIPGPRSPRGCTGRGAWPPRRRWVARRRHHPARCLACRASGPPRARRPAQRDSLDYTRCLDRSRRAPRRTPGPGRGGQGDARALAWLRRPHGPGARDRAVRADRPWGRAPGTRAAALGDPAPLRLRAADVPAPTCRTFEGVERRPWAE
jgi:hypothetical protein